MPMCFVLSNHVLRKKYVEVIISFCQMFVIIDLELIYFVMRFSDMSLIKNVTV